MIFSDKRHSITKFVWYFTQFEFNKRGHCHSRGPTKNFKQSSGDVLNGFSCCLFDRISFECKFAMAGAIRSSVVCRLHNRMLNLSMIQWNFELYTLFLRREFSYKGTSSIRQHEAIIKHNRVSVEWDSNLPIRLFGTWVPVISSVSVTS